jgi:glyoxylase-like metal-dependent hydrolase (beta-lactamase superfamily II)
MTFEGSKWSAKLITYEGGHCGSDAILYLPEDGIVFMEDLLFSGFHPYLEECNPDKIHLILAQIRKMQATTFVPGHGPVGDASQLDWMDEYIDTLNALVSEAIDRGATEEDVGGTAMPGKYQHLIFPNLFPANLKFLYQRRLRT